MNKLTNIINKIQEYCNDTGSKPATVTVSVSVFQSLKASMLNQSIPELAGVDINQSANVMGDDVVVQGVVKNPWYIF